MGHTCAINLVLAVILAIAALLSAASQPVVAESVAMSHCAAMPDRGGRCTAFDSQRPLHQHIVAVPGPDFIQPGWLRDILGADVPTEQQMEIFAGRLEGREAVEAGIGGGPRTRIRPRLAAIFDPR